jgi:hypothetical protein
MRQVIHAHRDGKYVAIDNPGAVVIDHDAKMIRAGLERWPVTRGQLFRFLTHMLGNADRSLRRADIGEALGDREILNSTLSGFIRGSEQIFSELGMVLETIHGKARYRLHSDPRETIECLRNTAPGQQLPWRLKSIPSGRGMPLMMYAKSRAWSPISTAG